MGGTVSTPTTTSRITAVRSLRSLVILHVGFDEHTDRFIPGRYLAVPHRGRGFFVTIGLVAREVLGSRIGSAIGFFPFALIAISPFPSAPPASGSALFCIGCRVLSACFVTIVAFQLFVFVPEIDSLDFGGIGDAISIPCIRAIDSFTEVGHSFRCSSVLGPGRG